MNTQISPSIFGTREDVKSLLSTLLPDVKSSERLEIFARQSGHRSDAAFSAFDGPERSLDEVNCELSKIASEGSVLPLLVAAGLPLLRENNNRRSTSRPTSPSAGDILRAASELIDRPSFKSGLTDLENSARAAPVGPCRWFYSVTASSVLFSKDEGKFDKFWATKSAELLCGILALSNIVGGDKPIDRNRLEFLETIDPEYCDPWSKPGYDLIKDAQHAPQSTRESVFQSMISQLPRITPDLGIYPGKF